MVFEPEALPKVLYGPPRAEFYLPAPQLGPLTFPRRAPFLCYFTGPPPLTEFVSGGTVTQDDVGSEVFALLQQFRKLIHFFQRSHLWLGSSRLAAAAASTLALHERALLQHRADSGGGAAVSRVRKGRMTIVCATMERKRQRRRSGSFDIFPRPSRGRSVSTHGSAPGRRMPRSASCGGGLGRAATKEDSDELPVTAFLSSPMDAFEEYICDDTCLLRFLNASNMIVFDAFVSLMASLRWRRRCLPHLIPPAAVEGVHKTGLMYRRGWDNAGRPVIYFRAALFNCVDDQRTYFEALAYHMERALWSEPLPGGGQAQGDEEAGQARRQRSVSLIVDYTGATEVNSLPLSTLKSMCGFFFELYPGVVESVYVVNPVPFRHFEHTWQALRVLDRRMEVPINQSVIKIVDTATVAGRDTLLASFPAKTLEPWFGVHDEAKYFQRETHSSWRRRAGQQRDDYRLWLYDSKAYWDGEEEQFKTFVTLWTRKFGQPQWNSEERIEAGQQDGVTDEFTAPVSSKGHYDTCRRSTYVVRTLSQTPDVGAGAVRMSVFQPPGLPTSAAQGPRALSYRAHALEHRRSRQRRIRAFGHKSAHRGVGSEEEDEGDAVGGKARHDSLRDLPMTEACQRGQFALQQKLSRPEQRRSTRLMVMKQGPAVGVGGTPAIVLSGPCGGSQESRREEEDEGKQWDDGGVEEGVVGRGSADLAKGGDASRGAGVWSLGSILKEWSAAA